MFGEDVVDDAAGVAGHVVDTSGVPGCEGSRDPRDQVSATYRDSDMSRIPEDVAAAVIERADGGCEMVDVKMGCCWFRGPEFHHRQARAMGGSKGREQDTVGNLLALCHSHHAYVHAHPHWARKHGYIVSQFADTPSVVSFGESV